MHQISIPDSLYSAIESLAIAEGISVDIFVNDALESRLSNSTEASLQFSPTDTQVLEILEAQSSVDAGDRVSLSEFESRFAAKKASWRQAHRV